MKWFQFAQGVPIAATHSESSEEELWQSLPKGLDTLLSKGAPNNLLQF